MAGGNCVALRGSGFQPRADMIPSPILLRLAGVALLLFPGALCAADLYLTPTGAGKKDGSNWENALAQGALNETLNERMKPGDRLMLGGGTYPDALLKVATGGAPGKPKAIIGVDRGAGLPLFSSNWSVDHPDKGPTCISLEPGVSHVTMQHLRIKGYCFGVKAHVSPAAPRTHLAFDDVDVEQQRHGYYLSDCDDLLIENCDLKRYSKHGFRFDQGCDRVAVRKCTADCSEGDEVWETKTEIFPFGFTVNDGGAPNTKLTFEDCVTRNNRKSNQGSIKYTNGDGFVVEANSQEVTFTRCRAFRNQDGGFDLKVAGVRLTNCIATGHRRDFRIWHSGTLTNCFAGWSTTGLWCKEGSVTADHCTFHQHKNSAVEVEDKATAPVVLADCLVSSVAASPKIEAGKTQAELKNTAEVGWDGHSDGSGDVSESRVSLDAKVERTMKPQERYVIIDALSDAQIEQLHVLYQGEWWTTGRTLADVREMMAHCDFIFGVVERDSPELVGFARVLTDHPSRASGGGTGDVSDGNDHGASGDFAGADCGAVLPAGTRGVL
jgi:hypothetical protein